MLAYIYEGPFDAQYYINQVSGCTPVKPFLGDRVGRIRNSRSSSTTEQVHTHPGLHKTLFPKKKEEEEGEERRKREGERPPWSAM